MSWKYPDDIIHRKLSYIANLASEDGIALSMDRWIGMLQEIQLEISFEEIFRALAEIYLQLNFSFDWSSFDFPLLPSFDLTIPICETGGKAYYGKSKYGSSFYDPPDVSYKDLERFFWSLRYMIAEKGTVEYKQMSTSLKTRVEAHKDALKKLPIKPELIDSLEEIMSLIEGKILRGFYVGFAVVGVSRVAQKSGSTAHVETRDPKDWKTAVNVESNIAYENVVGWSRVGYFTVSSPTMVLNKKVSDKLVEKINDFWMRSGMVSAGELSPYGGPAYTVYGTPSYRGYEVMPLKTLYQRIFFLQRTDQLHYTGGAHQLKMQFNIKKVKPILDRSGVIANARQVYTSFAHEVFYLNHDSHRLYKRWKQLLTEEDIVQKYIRMGCQESVLREVLATVKP